MRRQRYGIARRDDERVGPVGQGALEQRNIALAETRIRMELDLDGGRERRGRFTNALTQRFPEQRVPVREVDADPHRPA